MSWVEKIPAGGGPLLFSTLNGLTMDLQADPPATQPEPQSRQDKSAKASRTLSDFQQDLAKQNKTVRQWALDEGFDLSTVYAVCHGRTKGKFGASRQVMKAMGLPVPKV